MIIFFRKWFENSDLRNSAVTEFRIFNLVKNPKVKGLSREYGPRSQGVFGYKNGLEINHLFFIVDHLRHIFSKGGHSETRQ